MNSLKLSRFLLYIELLLFFLQHYSFALYEKIAYFNIITVFLYSFFISKTVKRSQIFSLILVLSSIILFLLYNIFYIEHIGYGAIFFLLCFQLQYIILSNFEIKKDDYKYIILLFICFLFLLDVDKMMSLGFNTNTISFVYLVCGIFSTLFLELNNKKNKILFAIIVFTTTVGILNSESRTALIAYWFYILLLLYPSCFIRKKYLFLSINLFLTIGALLYVFIYIYMSKNLLDISDWFFTSKKDFFSGREIIWEETFNLFKLSPFIGIGSNINLRMTDSTSLHNSMLNLLFIYGILIFIPTIYILLKSLYNIWNYFDDKLIKKCIFAYWAFLIVSFSETCLFQECFICAFPLMIAYSRINSSCKISNSRKLYW